MARPPRDTVTDEEERPTLTVGARAPEVQLDAAAALGDDTFEARYRLGELLGAGAMGEVRAVHDGRIGREVAMKVVRRRAPASSSGGSGSGALAGVAPVGQGAAGEAGPDAGSRPVDEARFLREARVQGQLEHPAIVPVYDLGLDAARRPFFTMKRVRGVTLERIVERLALGDPDARARHSRRRLLTAFSSVCLAVDFAHQRGVLHRDLKPANLMLGDFGEVYVLDWGVARLMRAPVEDAGADGTPDAGPVVDEGEAVLAPRTQTGMIVGTPGYMAPEQVRGEVDQLDGTADVYALGAILFELLALEPLHPGVDPLPLISSTLAGADARPSTRAGGADVPPELDAVCVRATALARGDRYPSARALSQAIERFLDGDRDLALRRELSARHAERAAAAAAVAAGRVEPAADRATDATAEAAARTTAMREVSHALALDPGNTDATRTLVRLLTEPPRHYPAEAEAELDALARATASRGFRFGALAYSTTFLYVPVLALLGTRSWGCALVGLAAYTLAAASALYYSRRPHPRGSTPYPLAVAGALAVSTSSLLFGPFIVLPTVATVNAVALMLDRQRHRRVVVAALNSVALLAPLGLEAIGALPPSYRIEHGELVIMPRLLELPPVWTPLVLASVSLALLLTASMLIARVRDGLAVAERRQQLQAWQLRKLVPDEATRAASGVYSTHEAGRQADRAGDARRC